MEILTNVEKLPELLQFTSQRYIFPVLLNICDFSTYSVKCGAPHFTDMRKQINGLSALVQEEMKLDVFGNSIFIFCNKPRNRLKILYWDKNGFALYLKKLEKDKFPWPKNLKEVKEITQKEIELLLSGIDFWNAHKQLFYEKVC